MAEYPNSGSILNAQTHTALSTQIVILVNNEPVGAIQTFGDTQSRTNARIKEVGTDGTLEIVPQTAANLTVNVDRIVYDGLSVTEAFARGFRNIQSQRIAFDIVVVDQFSGSGDNAVITTYHECWFNNISKTYSVNDYIITEGCNIDVTYISTIRGGGPVSNSQGVGGGRQIGGIQLDSVEQDADTGQRRGALDAAGLISAAF